MAVTIELDLTEMFDFDVDSTAISSSQGTPDDDGDNYVEGVGGVDAGSSMTELRSVGVQWIKYTKPTGSWDISNNHVYIWFMTIIPPSSLNTKLNGGIRILLGDTSGNIGHWYVDGSDTYTGGWRCLVVDTSKTPDWNSGTVPTMTIINQVGIAIDIITAFRNVNSTWVDIARYGDGITVTSDALCDLDDIMAISENTTNASGIIRKEGGVFFLQGKLRLGDTDAGDSIQFAEESEVIIFEDKEVNANLYEILIQANSTGTIEIAFGTKSGTRGISGCIIKSAGTPKFDFTATSTDIDKLQIYGTTFYEADSIQLPPNATNREVIDCSFEKCGEVIGDTIIMTYCNFISSDNQALRISDIGTTHNKTECNFINCVRAVKIDTIGTYTFDAMIFTGNTYDVENSTAGLVTVNATNGSNPDSGKIDNSGGGTTDIINTVQITVNVEDEAGSPIDGASVAVMTVDPQAMKGAVADDGGTQTDETTEANSATADDMTLLPAIPVVDDAYYFGSDEPFHKLRINVGINGDGVWTIVWEYYNGTIWSSITDVTDETEEFTSGTGNKEVYFSPPTDWATTTIASISAFWIRARVSAYTSITTQPKGTQSWIFKQIMNETTNASGVAQEDYNYSADIDVIVRIRKSPAAGTKYIPAQTTGEVLSTGYTLSWVLIEDIIAE